MDRLAPPDAGSVPSDSPTGDSPGFAAVTTSRRSSSGRGEAALVFVVYAVGSLLLTALRVHEIHQPITYDAGNYEYYSGYGLLHGFGSAIALPGQLETYLDAQMNTLYYFLISHFDARAVVYTIASLQSLAVTLVAFLVFLVGRRATASLVGPLIAGVIAGAAAFITPIHISEVGETSSDVLLGSLVFIGAALLYEIVTADTWQRRWYWQAGGAGVLLGLAGELKFTQSAFSAAVVIAFAVALVVAHRTNGWRYRRILLLLVVVLLPAVAVAAALYVPEGILLWQRYRDPFFPLLNGIFHSHYLLPGSFNPGYAANSIPSLWHHFTRLLVGGDVGHNSNGLYLEQVRSPVLFFALIVVAVFFVVDLVKRTHPDALFLELSFLLGFLLWAVLFGFYRYLAPVEMAAFGVVVMLVFVHELYRPVLLVGAAGLVALAVPFSVYATIGGRAPFGTSYFGVRPSEFTNLQGDGVVLAGGGTMAYIVPDFPPDIELVRAGGNLGQVMSHAWWQHVRSVLRANPRSHWVVFYGGDKGELRRSLREVGFPGGYHSCRYIETTEAHAGNPLHECQVDLAT